MKLKYLIFILMILLLIGCKKQEGYKPTITSRDIYTGKEALTMEFLENAPPLEAYENSQLPIGLRMGNRGASNIKQAYLSIGLEKEYVELDQNSLKSINQKADFKDPEHITFDLEGKTIENPKGEQEIITFSSLTKDLRKTDPQSEYHDTLVSITSCYEYETKAVETVCIDTDVYGFKKREKSCEVGTLTLNPQGAPIAVTKIESEMLPDKDQSSTIKPRFTITIKNLGKGEVVKKDKVKAACSSESIAYQEWNNINVNVYISDKSEENKLDCDIVKEGIQDGTLILKQKENSIRCTYEKGFDETKGTFSSPLYITLDYGYTDTISKNVKIKKVLAH